MRLTWTFHNDSGADHWRLTSPGGQIVALVNRASRRWRSPVTGFAMPAGWYLSTDFAGAGYATSANTADEARADVEAWFNRNAPRFGQSFIFTEGQPCA